MSEPVVLIDKAKRICTLTLNRPHIMNAFDLKMSDEMQDAFDRISKDKHIQAVILQGAGNHFSSGADMRLLDKIHTKKERVDGMRDLGKLIRTMRELPQPIIARVKGVAYGVGINIALACDFVVAAHTARLCQVFINIGAVMDGGGTYFLPRLVGMVKAKELALLGDEFDGKTAASMGLIYKTVPARRLDKEVNALAKKLVNLPPSAMGSIKKGLEQSFDMNLKDVLKWEETNQTVMLGTKEHKQAVRRFLKSRKTKREVH
jgi:2-(1,2-epoxy-1,2-dihydrophenyl)acetyl-CoA isomerase